MPVLSWRAQFSSPQICANESLTRNRTWRKSYVKRHFCVSPRRWKLAPRIMPLSCPGYSITHDELKYISVFSRSNFEILYMRKAVEGFFQDLWCYFFMTLPRLFPKIQGSRSKSSPQLTLNIFQIDTWSATLWIFLSSRVKGCSIVNVLTANWEIIVSASPQPCPSTSRSNFQRKAAALLQARPANSLLACITDDAK